MNYFWLLFSIFGFLFLKYVDAQIAPEIKWQKCLGGSSDDDANSISQTNDGGFIIGGSTDSQDGDISGCHGSDDGWILKLDSAGSIIWQKCLGGSSYESIKAVEQTDDGGFIIGGYSNSNDGDVFGNHGNTDYWIIKLSDVGNIIWQKCLGGSDYDYGYSVQQTIDHGFIVAGTSYSNDGDVSGNHGNGGYYRGGDDWIVKLDSSGNLIWQKCLGGSSDDWASSVQQTADGQFIVAGGSFSDDGDVSGNHGGPDYWIMKLDTNGDLLWQKCLGGSDYDYAYSIQQTNDGGFITIGWGGSTDDQITENHGNGDCWVVKLDIVGNIVWQNSLGGSGGDSGHFIEQTIDGGFIGVAVTQNGEDGDVSGYNEGWDYWIVKLDSAGGLLWQQCLGGSGHDYSTAIIQTNDEGYIISGHTNSNDGDVTGLHGTTTNYDCWIVRLAPDTLTGIESIPSTSFSVFPNPVENFLTLILSNGIGEGVYSSSLSNIAVYNLHGQKVSIPSYIDNNRLQLDVSNLSDGMYFLQIINRKTGVREGCKFVKGNH